MSTIYIPADSVELEGELILPPAVKGVVIFAHGSGSSRLSPRNLFVAQILQQSGIGTLLFDLLTRDEDLDYTMRFDIDLLTQRLFAATALQAAAEKDNQISVVVSRGGRPDLAGEMALQKVTAPTLLIVGSADNGVIELNQRAFEKLHCEKKLTFIPGATHLFEEPGALEQAAQHAVNWFLKYLTMRR
ncbi:MAG TPA: hydrolase [Nitrosomonas sp.]|nr:hydrolase [Nitrosomonas sp.]